MNQNNTRTINKPWGKELIWVETTNYVGKIISINSGHRLSRQYHERKHESFYIVKGVLTLEVGDPDAAASGILFAQYQLRQGDTFDCPPGTIHRMINDPALNTDRVEVLEVSTNHLDDVVRLSDDYKRA
jgi:mannose-6-phosphate isomerase